jgi:hypothetical protein
MPKKKLLHLFVDQKIPQEVGELLLDTSLYGRHRTLRHHLDDQKIPYDAKEYAALVAFIEKSLYDQIFYIAHLQYHLMQANNDWSEVGEQQIKLAFSRCLLDIPPEEPLDYSHASEFESKVEENIVNLGIKSLSVAAAKNQYEHTYLKLLGQEFKANPGLKISEILSFLGSKYRVQSRPFWKGFSYILGEMLTKTKAEYTIHFITKEWIRTPSYVMANAALVAEHTVYMREESLRAVFVQKWVQAAEFNWMYQHQVNTNLYWNISHAIKKITMDLYEAGNVDQLNDLKKTFVGDMRETIMYHEIGHGITKDYIFPYEFVAIAQGLDRYHKLPAYEALIEFLSDFSPTTHGLIGPYWNMLTVAKTNPLRAERLFYMYLSDVFFYDTEDQYMYTYSDFMCLMCLRYIKPDKHIDFAKMEKDLSYMPGENGNIQIGKFPKASLFQRLGELFWTDCDVIKQKVKGLSFTLSGERDFNYIKGLWLQETRKFFKHATDKDPAFLSSFWVNIFSYIDHFSKEAAPGMKAFLEKQDKTVAAKLMVAMCGRKVAEDYKFDARAYIMDRFKELGFETKS